MENKTIYIIGNGFDLHHGLDTSYLSFAKKFANEESRIFDLFVENFGLENVDENTTWEDAPLWGRFEAVLGEIHADALLDKYEEFRANPAADNFSDGDWDNIEVYINQEVDEMLVGMNEVFSDFINKVKHPSSLSNKLKLDSNAKYLNFNYTHTLELLYNIPRNQIKYIHNRAGNHQKLILGHGVTKPNPFQDEIPPKNLTDEELIEWNDNMAESFDLSIQRGKWAVEQYYFDSLKDTGQIIKDNVMYFSSLNSINEIVVIGHSMSQVDHPYFSEIINNIDINTTKWIITYYNQNARSELAAQIQELKIPNSNVSFIQINELR